MPFVKFRGDWSRKGVNHQPGDVVEVEDWEAEQLIARGKARLTDAPPIALAEPTDAELLADAMPEGEDQGPQFKTESVSDAPPVSTGRKGRQFK